MSKEAITIKDLNMIYPARGPVSKEFHAVRNLNLEIKEGSFFSLLGPNGAGKSTTINIISSIIKKTSGTITINGYNLDTQAKQCKQSIGVSMQELYLDPFLTVAEYLEYTAGFFGINTRDPKHREYRDEIVGNLQLGPFLKRNSRAISGGTKRRLSVAKALLHRPKILILDEPTAGVDIGVRKALWEYLKNLNRTGTTIILTTHYLEEAQELSDTIAIINKGEIILNDSKSNVLLRIDKATMTVAVNNLTQDNIPDLATVHPEIVCVAGENSGELKVVYNSKINPMHIVKAIEAAQLNITDLTIKHSDLEDVFIDTLKLAI